jgi:hypothetical protein
MKRVWVLVALAVWTAGVVFATTALVPRRLPQPQPAEQLPKASAVQFSSGNWDSEEGGRWMLADQHFARTDAVHVNREDLADGGVRVRIDNADGFSSDVVTIELHRDPDARVHADASVEWTSDFGPPFRGEMAHLTGYVTIKDGGWAGPLPLVVNFELHGLIAGIPQCVHGEVSAPR